MSPPKKTRAIPGLLALLIASVACLAEASCNKPSEASTPPIAASVAPLPASAGRKITITATNDGYAPASIDVKKGEPVVLVFTRKTKSDCLAEVTIPDLGVKKDLPLDTPVEIPVKFDKEGKVGFQCGMAMVKGTINVGG